MTAAAVVAERKVNQTNSRADKVAKALSSQQREVGFKTKPERTRKQVAV